MVTHDTIDKMPYYGTGSHTTTHDTIDKLLPLRAGACAVRRLASAYPPKPHFLP